MNEKKKYLLSHGWETFGDSGHYVKTEWLSEPETLNRPAYLCPNWYHVESLDSAYAIEMENKEKEEYLLSHGWEKIENGYVRISWIDKTHPMNIPNAYIMEMSD